MGNQGEDIIDCSVFCLFVLFCSVLYALSLFAFTHEFPVLDEPVQVSTCDGIETPSGIIRRGDLERWMALIKYTYKQTYIYTHIYMYIR